MLTFGQLLYPAPITDKGQIWYPGVDQWSMLMYQILSRSVYSVTLRLWETPDFAIYWTSSFCDPLSSDRQHLSCDVCLEVRGRLSELFCFVLCTEAVHSHKHT